MDPRVHERPPLAERLGWDRKTKPQPKRQNPPTHCWVIDCPELPGRRPGLLLQWHKGATGWRGQVVVAAQGMEGLLVLTMWVAAENLRPGDA